MREYLGRIMRPTELAILLGVAREAQRGGRPSAGQAMRASFYRSWTRSQERHGLPAVRLLLDLAVLVDLGQGGRRALGLGPALAVLSDWLEDNGLGRIDTPEAMAEWAEQALSVADRVAELGEVDMAALREWCGAHEPSRREKCDRCDGSSRASCCDCDGRGRAECPTCSHYGTCKECDGTGKVRCPAYCHKGTVLVHPAFRPGTIGPYVYDRNRLASLPAELTGRCHVDIIDSKKHGFPVRLRAQSGEWVALVCHLEASEHERRDGHFPALDLAGGKAP